jgi:hypothetical protein
LGSLLTNLARFSEAETFLISAFEGLTELDRKFPTRTAGYYAETYTAFVTLYQRWGRAEESERWRQRGLAFAEELREKRRPLIAAQLKADLEKLASNAFRP